MAEASKSQPATVAPTQAPTTASVSVDLHPFSALKTRFTKLDVERTGRVAALANNKVLLVYDLEKPDKHHDFFPYKHEQQRLNAISWNPHHNRRLHLASAKGREVIIWHLEDTASPTGETTLRKHTSEVMDICWSRLDEHLLVSASHAIFCWDTRAQNPVREWKVPGMLTTQVSFNRKNAHLLASSFQNQVCVWDLRKVQKPVLTIPAHLPKDTVTSLDWSHESEYHLLTSGGVVINLWSVVASTAKQLPSPANASTEPGLSFLQHKHVWTQPMQKVLFAPVGQAAITSSRGFFEEKHGLQTIRMWSLAPTQRFKLLNTFGAGRARILGLSWRATSDGGYQVASLDDADHLRLHDIEEANYRSTGVDLPAGDSSTWRDYGSTAGSESLEGTAALKAPALRDDIVPVVWSFSKLQSPASAKMAIETAGENPLRELMQVEKLAKLGGLGSVSNVQLHPMRKSISLTLIASAEARRPSSSDQVAQQVGSQAPSAPENGNAPDAPASDGVKYVAVARLRVTAKALAGHRLRDEHALAHLESEGGSVSATPPDSSTTPGADPLDDATVKRMQAAAGDTMRQALKSRQPRLQVCLLEIRRDLEERVREVVNQAAGVVSGHDFLNQRAGSQADDIGEARALPPEMSAERHAREIPPGVDRAMYLSDEPIVPCPRRFGATFAPNGTLVVFSSALGVVRARMDGGGKQAGKYAGNKQVSSAYPRTYSDLLEYLQKIERVDVDDEIQGDAAHPAHSEDPARDEHRSWFRSWWGYSPNHSWEEQHQDGGTYDLDRYSTEGSIVEEDLETRTSHSQDDSTRLPISHPDHSLGAGLGPQSDTEPLEKDSDEDTTIVSGADLEGELPWTPKPKQVVLVDCSRFLPGSPYLAAFYKLGPLGPPMYLQRQQQQQQQQDDEVADPPAEACKKDAVQERKSPSLFDPLALEIKTDSGAGSDASVSSGGRSRRNSPVFGSTLGVVTTMPPPLAVMQRGVTSTQETLARGGGMTRRTSVEGAQILPPALARQRQWESSPDFKALRGSVRGASSSSRGGWGTPVGSGSGIYAGSPAFTGGSPGRWERPRTLQRQVLRKNSVDEIIVGSPHQASELANVAEFPLQEPRANITPPRPRAQLKEDGPVFPIAGGIAGSGDTGTSPPGQTLGWNMSSHHRHSFSVRKAPAKTRQNYPLSRSPGSSCGPPPPLDTSRLRLAALSPASPADAAGPVSTSPPMSDCCVDHGQVSALSSAFQTALNAGPHGAVHRRDSSSSSFSAGLGGVSLGFGEYGGGGADGSVAGQVGLGGRGRVPGSSGDYASFESVDTFNTGNRSRSGTDLWRGSNPRTTVDEGSAEDCRPSVGYLSRHNGAVAAVSGRGELASFWALMADAADKGALEPGSGTATGGQVVSRCYPSWKRAGPRLTATVLGHFETTRDPQMLASIACVLGSASRDGGCGEALRQGEDKMETYDRYLACYAERLYQWGAQGVRAETISHQTGKLDQPRDAQTPKRQSRHDEASLLCDQHHDKPQGPLHCSVCSQAVYGEYRACRLCRHGGHWTHIENWFRDESECPQELCACLCLEIANTPEEAD